MADNDSTLVEAEAVLQTGAFVLPFECIGMGDVAIVGGKNASLGELIGTLGAQAIRVPDGFATTADAYRLHISSNGIEPRIRDLLASLHAGEKSLRDAGAEIRALILAGTLPPPVEQQLRDAYCELGRKTGRTNPAVAVRSSATAEDLPGASFAGQLESFLNVQGEDAFIDACRRCFASLFTDRAITYREAKGFDHLQVALSIGVQLMVRSDLGGSGVMFTLDTESGFPRVVTINAALGLGETVVQGTVDPDRLMVFKPLLRNGYRPIIEKVRGAKNQKLVYGADGRGTELLQTSEVERESFVLSDDEALRLARWGVAIEAHYGRPMDVEWAKDGASGELFIVQARPETVHAAKSGTSFDVYTLQAKGQRLVEGVAIGGAIVSGKACIVRNPEDIERFEDGAILVAEATNPDWVPIMKRAAGIVTDHGGPTSHAAIVGRELGVTAVIGTGNGTSVLRAGQEITVSCAEGSRGAVYSGILPFVRETIDVGTLGEPPVDIMVNMANPGAAFEWWRLPANGVGLARMEFIIGSAIKLHPMAAAHPERLSAADAEMVRALSEGFTTPADYFVDRLAVGVAKLASAFHPYPAIVRLSDFKTNEYADLIGGEAFEPKEENPMLGFRGASRYYNDRYKDGFALECRALKRVREEMGFTNLIVMVPFCRTVTEADRVLQAMAENGLRRGKDGLQVYMMCEIPSNVILAEEFAKRFDGFSIGSNDLTQLVLGVDRDSADLADLFDERDEAVKRMVGDAIDGAHRAGIKVGICGQAPSNYPEFAQFLVEKRIDSISLNPDSFVTTVRALTSKA
ncbi:phosphoenolpyruvate synthase [Sphingomonas sediminicola]|uniref:Phosphoenolpyruvate synthase n=1 Tax=Sphingomonas sediminicola TaxID=386874 RepID=A0ABX6T8D6_9SPHN|nr:phosphoenolpyruvate synthase [Sphingomonas sediminicola]QNP46106.1 phosphoenolpyruvate synthase [Sphingomonas sediminicola]